MTANTRRSRASGKAIPPMGSIKRKASVLLILLLAGAGSLRAADEKPFLHPLFADHMVLQRDMAVPVWGWTEAGEEVTVSMRGKTAKTVADAQGRWLAKLGRFPAGGPYTLTVSGPQSVTVNDVLVGDVWICSGQSNMTVTVAGSRNGKKEVAKADFPNIRLLTVPNRVAFEPQPLLNSAWLVCSPTNICIGQWGGFSGVAYFFGRHLHQELKIPIGLIHTSWPGSPAEAWTSVEALKTLNDFKRTGGQLEQTVNQMKQGIGFDESMVTWWQENDPDSDKGKGKGVVDPAIDTSTWKTMDLPKYLPRGFGAVIWFQRTFDLPAAWEGKDLTLSLGVISNRDTTFINGTKAGATNLWSTPRIYTIPNKLVNPGRNTIAVRILTGPDGGICGKPEQMKVEPVGLAGAQAISLAGTWRVLDNMPLANLTSPPPPQPLDGNPGELTVLYNGMIAPLIPFAIKGAIWYQGETNGSRGYQYRALLPTLIKDWRSRFGVGDFGFYIVQLANGGHVADQPRECSYAELREAQSMTARDLPNCGIAVAIDIGAAPDDDAGHPRNKQDVGRRLALSALAITYGQKIEYSGPIYKSMAVKDRTIRLSFDHLGGGAGDQGRQAHRLRHRRRGP